MQASLKTTHDNFVSQNLNELLEARVRADAVDTGDMNLGESTTARFLAATGFSKNVEAAEAAIVIKN